MTIAETAHLNQPLRELADVMKPKPGETWAIVDRYGVIVFVHDMSCTEKEAWANAGKGERAVRYSLVPVGE